MTALTRCQQAVLDFIRRYAVEYGHPRASLREIANVIGVKHTNGVREHLRSLEAKGYIRLGPGFQIGLAHAAKRDAVVEAAREVLVFLNKQDQERPTTRRLRAALAALDGAS